MNKKVLLILGTVVFGIALLLILYFVKPTKEGFGVYDHLDKNPGEYERQSKSKFNLFSDATDLTRGNFINSIDPGQIDQANVKMKASMSTSDPTPSSYANTLLGLQTLDTTSELAQPNLIMLQAKKCEALRTRGTCKDLDDPQYASCGVCIKGGTPVTYNNPDKHIGGLLVLPDDRREAEVGGNPYYPTIGSCPAGHFFVNRAKCERESNRLDCKEAGESGGFQGGRTVEGNDVIGQKCAQVPKRGDDQFVYEPKTRKFNIVLRALAPAGTGICKIYVYNLSNGGGMVLVGQGVNSTPGSEFVINVNDVKEGDELRVYVATESPFRSKGNPELFQLQTHNNLKQVQAGEICKRNGASHASKSQMLQAVEEGMQVCGNGWGSDFSGWPSQATYGDCGKGKRLNEEKPTGMDYLGYGIYEENTNYHMDFFDGNDLNAIIERMLRIGCDSMARITYWDGDQWRDRGWTGGVISKARIRNRAILQKWRPPPLKLKNPSDDLLEFYMLEKPITTTWCYGVKPPQRKQSNSFSLTVTNWFDSFGSKSNPSQGELPNLFSKHGANYQAPFERAILLQWEMAGGRANRVVPFESTIMTINEKAPTRTNNDGSRVFKTLRKFGSFKSSTTITSPKHSSDSKILSNNVWLWANNPKEEQIQFTAKVPGIFLDTFYEEDRVNSSIGPLVGNAETAKLLQTSPCMREGQAAGKYSLECLQNLFVSSGGDINSGKLVSENGGLNQLNAKGDMDTIAGYLADLYNLATSGKDANGQKVGSNAKEHAQIVNDAAQLLFGFDISTPCEDITEDADGNIVLKPKIGAVDADCLDWLWMNTGTDQSRYMGDGSRKIKNTYVSIGDRFSGLTSTEGNKELRSNYPFQTCQRTGSLAPIAKTGALNNAAINEANAKGGIPAIQDYYNSIFQLANNPASKDRAKDQENAMEKCYGVKKAVPKMAGPKDIPGLFGWFDGNDPLDAGAPPTNGSPIPIWKDKSGNNNDMKSMQSKPAMCITGLPGPKVMYFDKNWYRQTNPSPYPLDVFVVLIPGSTNGITGKMDVIGLGQANSDNFNSLTYGEYSSGSWHNGSSYFQRTGNAVANRRNEYNVNGHYLLMQWSIANNNFYIYRNGVKIASTTSYTWNPGTPYLQIGNRYFVTTGQELWGIVAEVVAFKGQLSDENRQKMEGYLSKKWGLTANLPAGHPYK